MNASEAGILSAPVLLRSPDLDAPTGLRAATARAGADQFVLLEWPRPPVTSSGEVIFPGRSQRSAAAPAEEPEAVSTRPGMGVAPHAALHAIHTCYSMQPGEDAWLRRVLRALAPLDRGLGRFARLDAFGGATAAPRVIAEGADGAAIQRASEQMAELLGAEAYRDLHGPYPAVQLFSTRTRVLPVGLEERVHAILRVHGIDDFLGIFGGDVGGAALLVGVVMRHGVRVPSRTVGVFRHVAGHLGAARQLRSLAAREDAAHRPSPPDGLAAGVGAPAIHELLDWIPAPLPAPLWRAFVEGKWTLVERTVGGERCHVVARRAQEGRGDPTALRPREREVLAHALQGRSIRQTATLVGVSPAAVAAHLDASRRKLIVSGRGSLAEILGLPG